MKLASDQKITLSALLRRSVCLLMDLPDFKEAELDQVREANRQIAAIGRNLNMAVRALQSGQAQGVALELIERLRADVGAHREAIGALLRRHAIHGARLRREAVSEARHERSD